MIQQVFGVWDYLIMAATMVASLGIGLYFRFSGGKQKTNEEYLMADRNQPILPVAVSLMASFMSAISLLGISSENYYYGMQFLVINISYGIATPIASRLYLPVFFNLQKTSTYEYLELRFGPRIRLLASLTYTFQMVLYNGVVLYAPAIVLEAVTGLDRLIYKLVVGLACTVYSTLGGMKAVVFTDLLQSLLMFGAVLSVLICTAVQLGGFGKMFEIAREGGRLDFSNFSLDLTERNTWWSLNIGSLITYLSLYAVNHTQVQRLLTVSTLEKSQACLWWSWPVLSLLSIISCISGIGMYAVYRDCDPFTSKKITAIDQLMPYYVVDAMRGALGLAGLFVAGIFSASQSTISASDAVLRTHSPQLMPYYVVDAMRGALGLAGLFVAGIFSASQSTISASCNALAAVTLSDYMSRWFSIRAENTLWLTKLAACGYGLIFLALAFMAEYLGGVLQAAFTIFAAVGGPLFAVFTLGMFTTYANERGVSVALISGIALTLWKNLGGPRLPPSYLPLNVEGCGYNVTQPAPFPINPDNYMYFYRMSYLWTSPIGFAWVMIVGTVVSLAWKQEQPWEREGKDHPDPALFTPPLARRLRKRNLKNSNQSELLPAFKNEIKRPGLVEPLFL